MELQSLDLLTKKFTWKIPSFSKIVEAKHYSHAFSIEGGNWRILMYPKGNQTDHLSLYLDVPEAATMPQGWKQTACFSFIVVNQLILDNSKILGAQTEYTAESVHWGFNEFMPLSELHDPSKGFLVNDTLIVEVKFEPKLTGEYVVTPTKFSWKITNFPSLTEKYYYSPTFKIGHGNWKLLIFPIRDESQQTHLWLYLEVANQATLPEGWNINAKFKLVIVNQNDNSKSITEDIQNEFKWGDMRRGLPSSAELHDGNEGFIVNNTSIVEADFVPEEVEPTGEQRLELRSFTWKITNFTKLNAKKYYSHIFAIDGNSWTILMYPNGNETNNLSLYLNVPDSVRLPQDWKRSAHFSLIVVNQNRGGNDYQKGGEPVEFKGRKMERGYRDFMSLSRLHEPSNGYLVDDTLIVKVKFESELLGEHSVTSKMFKWKIKNFLSLTAKYYVSPTFEIDGIKWRLLIFPQGNGNDGDLSLYLHVVDFEALPEGWNIDATYKLLVVNQDNHLRSTTREEKNEFRAGVVSWGEQSMISSSELRDRIKGFIVNNTLIVQADFILLKIEPTTAPFHFHFSSMEKFISEAEGNASTIGSSSYNRIEFSPHATPSLDDILKAKQSLKECLSDLFKLNMKERLADALLILSRAESGLTADQQISIRTFLEGFDEFTSDFLAFEQANSKFELLKVQKDRVLSDLKKTQETHDSIGTKTVELAKREGSIQTRLQEIELEKEQLISEWEVLMVESKEAKHKYEIQEKKVAEVLEKKRFSEQKMSRSTAAWANMKAQFA